MLTLTKTEKGWGWTEIEPETVYFAVVNRAEHSGRISGPWEPDKQWPVRHRDERTGAEWETGWTEQDVCGAHGSILHEGTEAECQAALDAYLKCDSVEQGTYCYTHNPHAHD